MWMAAAWDDGESSRYFSLHQTTQNRAEDSLCRLMSNRNSAALIIRISWLWYAEQLTNNHFAFTSTTREKAEIPSWSCYVDVIEEKRSAVCSYENFYEMQCQLKVVVEISAREKKLLLKSKMLRLHADLLRAGSDVSERELSDLTIVLVSTYSRFSNASSVE